jgi:hypothetical protein
LLERDARDKVRDQHRKPVDREHLVKSHDSRVAKLGRGPDFALEPLCVHDGFDRKLMRYFERHNAVKLRVACLPHRAE